MNKLDEIVEKIINVDKANLSSYFEKTMWTRFEMGGSRQKTAYYYKMCQSPAVLLKSVGSKNVVVLSHVIGSDHMRGTGT